MERSEEVMEEEEVREGRKFPNKWEAKVEMEEEALERWKGANAAATAAEEEEEGGRSRGGRGRGGEGGSKGGCKSSKCSGTGFGFMGMCGYLSRCREKWTFKLPFVLNRFPHMLHLKGRSPICVKLSGFHVGEKGEKVRMWFLCMCR